MWFKNLRLYRLKDDFALDEAGLQDKLEIKRFHPCEKRLATSFGWCPPLGHQAGITTPEGQASTVLTHSAGGYILMCARREDKIMPAAVIRAMVAEKVAEIEAAEARSLHKREKAIIKDDLMQELLPRALCKSTYTYAYLDIKQKLLVVNAASLKQAEDLVSFLRASLGSLPVVPVEAKTSPATTMTQWLMDMPPTGISFEGECALYDPRDSQAVVRCRGQDLFAKEIQAHLEAGNMASQLAMTWEESLSFVLHEDLSIKRLRFTDTFVEHHAEQEAGSQDDAAARFDADYALMTLTLSQFITAILDHLGGLVPLTDD